MKSHRRLAGAAADRKVGIALRDERALTGKISRASTVA
jgi:hypothetical protein